MRVFMHFTLPNKRLIWTLALASQLSVGVYLIASELGYGIGFPLDDSWIHLTYARNLAMEGEWAFQPGKPSAGSTAPLWTALLALGFLPNLGPYIWTFFLGALLLWGMGVWGEMVLRRICPEYKSPFPWVGLFLILEWHMVWAASSGMETLLHALLVTIVLGMLMSGSRRFLTLGLLAGLSVWVRPDGITLLGPIFVYAIASGEGGKTRWRRLSLAIMGFLSLFGPYLLFNLILAGTPMPNTYYAKQAEYAVWQSRPFQSRLGELMLQFFAGPSLALLPGAIGWVVVSLRKRDIGSLVGMLWFVGYLFIYVERLPAYQHGRYIMPAMPIFLLWGLAALLRFSKSKIGILGARDWMVKTGWNTLTGVLCAVFWLYGANTYAQDVSLIESEMVVTAKWVSENVPSDEVIAVHDIGALGYFDDHALLDLAGLISPEVIPFIRDEEKLAAYLDDNHAGYLIAFPDFYPTLSMQAEPVFVSDGVGRELGGTNMMVYRWR